MVLRPLMDDGGERRRGVDDIRERLAALETHAHSMREESRRSHSEQRDVLEQLRSAAAVAAVTAARMEAAHQAYVEHHHSESVAHAAMLELHDRRLRNLEWGQALYSGGAIALSFAISALIALWGRLTR